MLRSACALLTILLAAPAAYAGSRVGGGFHGGGFHGGGFRGGGGYYGGGGGFHGGGGFRGGAVYVFHRSSGRARGFLGGYGYGYGLGLGYGYGGVYDSGYAYGYSGGGAGNAVSGGGDYSGGYVPDPEGADIPPVIFPSSCWVRRAAYDPSGAYAGQVLIDLCRPSDRVTLTRRDPHAQTPNPAKATGEPAPATRPGAPQSNP